MCYAKPGTRCYGHVRNEMIKTGREIRSLEAASTPDSESKVIQLREKYAELERELYYTKSGLKRIKEELRVTKDREQADKLKLLINHSQKVYDQRAKAYDAIHGTVDYREPSKNIREIDIDSQTSKVNELQESILECEFEILDNTHAEGQRPDPSKIKELTQRRADIEMKLDKENEKLSHAIQTHSHVKEGIIDDPTTKEQYLDEAQKMKSEHEKAFAQYQKTGDPHARLIAKYYYNKELEKSRKAYFAEVGHKIEMPVLRDKNGKTLPYGMTYDRETGVAQWVNYKTNEKYDYTDGIADDGKSFRIGDQNYIIGREKQPVTTLDPSAKVRPMIIANINRLKYLNRN